MTLVLEPTITAQWRQLVSEAQASVHSSLDEELESYLVFLLMRFAQEPKLLASIVATEYLESLLARGQARRDGLRDVGDRCLLFSGLFPHLARRRRVQISYYVQVGRGAYGELAHHAGAGLRDMFAHLAQQFVALMDVLQAMRQMNGQTPLLQPLEAFDLYAQTGSRVALSSVTSSTPIPTDRDITH